MNTIRRFNNNEATSIMNDVLKSNSNPEAINKINHAKSIADLNPAEIDYRKYKYNSSMNNRVATINSEYQSFSKTNPNSNVLATASNIVNNTRSSASSAIYKHNTRLDVPLLYASSQISASTSASINISNSNSISTSVSNSRSASVSASASKASGIKKHKDIMKSLMKSMDNSSASSSSSDSGSGNGVADEPSSESIVKPMFNSLSNTNTHRISRGGPTIGG